MGKLEITHSNCLCRIVDVKLTDCHRLETIRKQCGTSSLELMVRRWTLQWMRRVLLMDEDHLPRQDFFKLPGHIKLIPWPEIRAAAPERALDRQAWRDAV
eukprot:51205-Chlamydomonas_euryale.AAC.1